MDEPRAIDRIDVYTRGCELRGVPVPDAFMGSNGAAFRTRDDDVQRVVLSKLAGQAG